MNVLVSGASGLIGAQLCGALRSGGHAATALVRGENWNVETGEIRFEGSPDAVVHLAGENVAAGRWTVERKREIYDSRVPATRKLCDFLAANPPKVFVCASAVGIFGNRADEELTEKSLLGDDFLARVCRDWETATEPLAKTPCRVASARFGIVLSPEGGALAKMLPVFRKGLAGPLGSGKHWMSWIAIDDAVAAIKFLIEHATARGAFNIVSPNPATNQEFTRTLARVLKKPAVVSAPRLALKLAFGEMADVALLASQRALPARLHELGFRFAYPKLELALRHVLEHGA